MSVSLILIIITVVLSFVAFQNSRFFERALFRPYMMKQNNEWWRWVSNGFIHADIGHLFVNMFSLYFFSAYIEAAFNAVTSSETGIMFLVFYLSAIVVSGMFDYHKHQDQYSYSALGASGAVAAVIFAYIIYNPFGMIYLYAVIGIPAWLFGILYLFYEYYMGKKKMDNIGHNAHFFGAVYGLMFPILIHPQTGLNFLAIIADKF
jgi:membrane associated rhomboid family serine protease